MNIEELLADNRINIITENVIAVDLNGNIIYWNKGAEDIYGYAASEIIGNDTLALYPNENNEVIEKNLKIIKSGYSIRNYLTKRKRKDNTIIDVSITFSALKDKKGNVVGASVLTRDTAKTKEHERKFQESEITYKMIFENSGEGIFLMTNKFIEVNKKATEILGYSKEEIIGKSLIDFSPELQSDGIPSEKKANEYLKKAFKDGNVDFYWQYMHKNSEILETKISLNKIRIKGKPHIIVGMQNLTELFKYQNKLKVKTKELVVQNKKQITPKKDLINETTLNLLNKTILIVEDDLISMAFLEELLLDTNASIIKAYNGLQALEKFKENKDIDIVLMDIHLPEMNGNEVAKKIKEINKTIPVIAQSAYAMPKEREESFKYGCDDYLIKPIDSRLFFLTLKKFLK